MSEHRDAFVVWMDVPERPAEAGFRGAVEHVPTATRGCFETAAELVRFLEAYRGGVARAGNRHSRDRRGSKPV